MGLKGSGCMYAETVGNEMGEGIEVREQSSVNVYHRIFAECVADPAFQHQVKSVCGRLQPADIGCKARQTACFVVIEAFA